MNKTVNSLILKGYIVCILDLQILVKKEEKSSQSE